MTSKGVAVVGDAVAGDENKGEVGEAVGSHWRINFFAAAMSTSMVGRSLESSTGETRVSVS